MIRFLRNLFLKDFGLKLFSLVLAVLIWLTIYYARDLSPGASMPGVIERVTFTDLPVMVMSSAGDARGFKVNPKEVEVTVQGEPRVLRNLTSNDIRVLIDLTGIEAAHDLRKRIEVKTPPGVNCVRIVPEEVQVIFPSGN